MPGPEFPELLERYVRAARISTDDVNPETLEIKFPNGLSGGVARDMENVLAVNGNDLKFSLEQAFQVGLVVGAAMQRDGNVPSRFVPVIDAIGGPKT